MNTLERRYRRLLLAYPRDYRRANGEALVATLLEAAPGRRVPPAREAAALLNGGLAERARASVAGPVPWWVDGLHLALPPLILANVVTYSHVFSVFPWAIALFALPMLLVTFGLLRAALPVAALSAVVVSLPTPDLGDRTWEWLEPLGHVLVESTWPRLLSAWTIVAILAVLAVRGGPFRRRSMLWPAGLAALVGHGMIETAGVVLVNPYVPPWTPARAAVEVLLLALGVGATLRTRDARWALASSLYVLCAVAVLAESPQALSARSAPYWGAICVLAFASVVLTRRRVRADR